MLKIRKEQMAVMSDYMLWRFKDRTVKHLRKTYPKELHEIPEGELEAMIETGIERAKKYDVINEGDIKLYIECMVILSSEFDCDEKFPWAGDILGRKDITGQVKMAEISEYLVFGLE
jgi:hypothetical protein